MAACNDGFSDNDDDDVIKLPSPAYSPPEPPLASSTYSGNLSNTYVPEYNAPPSQNFSTPGYPVSQHQTDTAAGSNVRVIVASRPAKKTVGEAYILWFPLGLLGAHHFYLRRYGFGFLYFFTLGLCGVGWLVDGVRMYWLVRDANVKIRQGADYNEKVDIIDAYITWLPFGLFGLHHFFMRRPAWGVLYLFTLGLFGIGWLVDLFRMPCLVREANEKIAIERLHANDPQQAKLLDAYLFSFPPAGWFGAHHFYLGRTGFGIYYLFTLGGCGVGWIVDLIRLKWLVERVNHPSKQLLGYRHKYVDDAYVMAFPLGFLGLHHFYLERPGWGTLYFFTFGLFGVGWLFDLVRMPFLVASVNMLLEDEQRVSCEIRSQIGNNYNGRTPSEFVVLSTRPLANIVTPTPSSMAASSSAAESGDVYPILQPPPYTLPTAMQPPAYCGPDPDIKVKPSP